MGASITPHFRSLPCNATSAISGGTSHADQCVTQKKMEENEVSQANTRTRVWCFTLNNPPMTPDSLKATLEAVPGHKKHVFQLELAPTSQTPHFQGYVQFSQVKSFNQMRAILGNAHLERAEGSPAQNYAYCTDERKRAPGENSGPFVSGDFSVSQGTRCDLHAVSTELVAGASLATVATNHPVEFMKYSTGIMRFSGLLPPKARSPNLRMFIFHGDTGTGKTRAAMMFNDVFRKPLVGDWFDGYSGQATLLMDDFQGSKSIGRFDLLLAILDVYPVLLPVKGSFVWLEASTIIICTNIHPTLWYKDDFEKSPVLYSALKRRITEVRDYKYAWGQRTVDVITPANQQDWATWWIN